MYTLCAAACSEDVLIHFRSQSLLSRQQGPGEDNIDINLHVEAKAIPLEPRHNALRDYPIVLLQPRQAVSH